MKPRKCLKLPLSSPLPSIVRRLEIAGTTPWASGSSIDMWSEAIPSAWLIRRVTSSCRDFDMSSTWMPGPWPSCGP
jgi:hypothetical protein